MGDGSLLTLSLFFFPIAQHTEVGISVINCTVYEVRRAEIFTPPYCSPLPLGIPEQQLFLMLWRSHGFKTRTLSSWSTGLYEEWY